MDMVRRFCMAACLCLLVLAPVFAQHRTGDVPFYPNFLYKGKWKENIFVSAGGGASLALSSHNVRNGMGKALEGCFFVYGGKHVNPFWAWRAGVSGGSVSESGISPGGRTASYVNLHADLMCNLVNAFGGYRLKRHLVDVYVLAGPYANFPLAGGANPGVSAGGLLRFNLGKSLSIDLEGRLSRQRNMIYFDYDRFYFNGMVGVSYVFGGKTF